MTAILLWGKKNHKMIVLLWSSTGESGVYGNEIRSIAFLCDMVTEEKEILFYTETK